MNRSTLTRNCHSFRNTLQNTLRSVSACGLLAVWTAPVQAQEMPAEESVTQVLDEALLERLAPSAREILARRQGVSSYALRQVHAAVARYPDLGLSMYAYKFIDDESGALHRVLVNANGVEGNAQEMAQAQELVRKDRFGNLDSRLWQRLLTATAGETFPVELWLKQAEEFTPQRPDADLPITTAAIEEMFARNDARLESLMQATHQPVLEELQRRSTAGTVNPYAPVIHAELSSRTLLELSHWSAIDRIYLSGQYQPTLDVSRVVTGMAHAQNTYAANGLGIKIGEIEVGGDVNISNPYLTGTIRNTTWGFSDNHGTAVAGIIRSTHSTNRGYAPSCTLWCGSDPQGDWADLEAQANASVNWGALALNLSFGADIGNVPGAGDRTYDSIVFNRLRSVVVAAGNQGGITNNVTSPAMGYNVISVGNFTDSNTNRNAISNYSTTWGDDWIHGSSSFKDPVSVFNDREKPELAAPGTSIYSTSISYPWLRDQGFGTSYAAPAVTGAIAAMHSQNVNLAAWPEAVKAILMVTAFHNLEGLSRLSEKDGAGGLDAYFAVRCARRSAGNWGGYSYPLGAPNIVDLARPYLIAGRKARVVIAWQTDPTYWNYSNEPSSDLDLRVLDPFGREIGLSSSYDNTYEIIEITPSVTGYHTIRANREWSASTSRAIGWAWYQQ